jgi:predicted short-subunit dehydrogenase-like oxidoreductase (DUF2520 family)
MGIVGVGNVGRVLALTLKAAGYRVTELVARKESMKKAAPVARRVGAEIVELAPGLEITADVVWLCVKDDVISEVAGKLAKWQKDWRGKVALHTSGALSSKELAALKRGGGSVASAHLMNSFVKGSKADLRGVPMAIEGDAKAVRTANAAGVALGCKVFRIKPSSKVLYHAMGSFASPLLVSLLYAGERAGKAAGISEPRKVMERILRQTIENFLREGSAAAFSGPIQRGDVKTVQRHLRELKKVQGAPTIYKVLAMQAVHGLPGKEKAAMMKVLEKV